MASNALRVFKASDGYKSVELLKFASGHYHSACLLFETSPSCYDSTAFLAHNAIELVLKARLLERDGEFPGTHDLADLRELIEAKGIPLGLLPSQEEALYIIGRYDGARYPNPSQPLQVGSEDATLIGDLFIFLVSTLPADLLAEWERSPKNEKGGRVLMSKSKPPAT